MWGKNGIGPFARANVHHVLGQIAGIYLGKDLGVGNTKMVNDRQVTDLSQKYGQDNEAILDWLSALINAHVDIAKDAYIFNLNVNAATYTVGELLIRAGAGEDSFWFLAQPILKEYALAYNNSRGKLKPSNIDPVKEIKTKYRNLMFSAMRKERTGRTPEANSDVFNPAKLKHDIDAGTNHDSKFYARQLKVLDKFSSLKKLDSFCLRL